MVTPELHNVPSTMTLGEIQFLSGYCNGAHHLSLHIIGKGTDIWTDFPGTTFGYSFKPSLAGTYTFELYAKNTANESDPGSQQTSRTASTFVKLCDPIMSGVYPCCRIGDNIDVFGKCIGAHHLLLHITSKYVDMCQNFTGTTFSYSYTPISVSKYTFEIYAVSTENESDVDAQNTSTSTTTTVYFGEATLDVSPKYWNQTYIIGEEIPIIGKSDGASHLSLHIVSNSVDEYREYLGSSFSDTYIPTETGLYTFQLTAKNSDSQSDPYYLEMQETLKILV